MSLNNIRFNVQDVFFFIALFLFGMLISVIVYYYFMKKRSFPYSLKTVMIAGGMTASLGNELLKISGIFAFPLPEVWMFYLKTVLQTVFITVLFFYAWMEITKNLSDSRGEKN